VRALFRHSERLHAHPHLAAVRVRDDDAFAAGGEAAGDPDAARGRAAHDTLMDLYSGWDQAIGERVRALYPEGPPWDRAFLSWLGEEYPRAIARSRRALRDLGK